MAIDDRCIGCSKLSPDGCMVYPEPDKRWRLSPCPLATHLVKANFSFLPLRAFSLVMSSVLRPPCFIARSSHVIEDREEDQPIEGREAGNEREEEMTGTGGFREPYDKRTVDRLVDECSPKVKETSDPVFRPAHYTQWPIEPFTFLMLNQIPFAEGNVIKYVMRWRKKNGIEDLKKARRIIDMMIEMETNKAQYTPEKGCL